MSEEITSFLIAAIILAVLALFVPCLDSLVRALRRSKAAKAVEERKSSDRFIA